MRPLRQIVGAHLQCDFVSGQDADEVHAQLSGNVGQQPVAALDLHQKHGVGHRLDNGALYFDDIFFVYSKPLPSLALG